MLGVSASVDEMIIGFQGNHQDKLRINYKTVKDIFKTDVLAQKRYTCQFFMHNDLPPEKYKQYSPLLVCASDGPV